MDAIVLDPQQLGQGPASQDRMEAMEIFEQLVRQSQLQQVTNDQQIPSGISDVMDGMDSDDNSKGKKRKDSEIKICMALGCDKQIKRRRLCSTHQKQKERNNGKIELKEDFRDLKFTKGRSPTPFSKHANKYAKLKVFDQKIDQWAGGKEEGTVMLQAYIESSYYQARYPKSEDNKIYEQIGKNIVSFLGQLPEKSPLRKPLIKAMSEGIAPSRLTSILPISKRTIMYSKKLPDDDNLLLTIRYKPNVTRKKPDSDPQMMEGAEAGVHEPGNDEEFSVSGLASLGASTHSFSDLQSINAHSVMDAETISSEDQPALPLVHYTHQ